MIDFFVSGIRYNPLVRKILLPFVSFYSQQSLKSRNDVYQQLKKLLTDNLIIHVDEFEGDFFIDKNSHLFSRLLVFGNYEPKIVSLCLQNLDPSRDAIDIGANIGFYSVLFAKHLNPEQKVLSIEPTINSLDKLGKNITLNKVDAKVIIFNGVVSDAVGELSINTIPGMEEFSSLGPLVHPSARNSNFDSYKVESSTLDILVKKYSLNPGFIKCDVEGAEFLVLEGSHNVLTDFRPVVLMEVSDKLLIQNGSSAQEVINKLYSYGYNIIDTKYPTLKPGIRPFGDILCIPNST
jgi:FkbM family methyltransferase